MKVETTKYTNKERFINREEYNALFNFFKGKMTREEKVECYDLIELRENEIRALIVDNSVSTMVSQIIAFASLLVCIVAIDPDRKLGIWMIISKFGMNIPIEKIAIVTIIILIYGGNKIRKKINDSNSFYSDELRKLTIEKKVIRYLLLVEDNVNIF